MISRRESELIVEVEASKGYYVRALARDLGASLGFPAHLSQLRRLASGRFELRDACAWPASADTALLATAEAARRALPAAVLAETGERRARLGQTLESADFISLGEAPLTETEAWFNGAGEPDRSRARAHAGGVSSRARDAHAKRVSPFAGSLNPNSRCEAPPLKPV